MPDIEVSTAGAACAWIRGLMNDTPVAETEAPAEEAPAETPAETATEEASKEEPETPKPASSGSYFGRRSFRTGN